jgi:membrane-bound lytic murein transglycosylase B
MQYGFPSERLKYALCALVCVAVLTPLSLTAAADAGFTQFIVSLWPEAQAAGVPRATFDAETSGLEPDYKLPDLILPGRPATGAPSQAEFVQVPADYVKEASIAALAAEGQRLMAQYRAALTAIEARFGVPATIVLAILGWRSGAVKPITAATRCPMTGCAYWRRRPMSAAARISIATSSSWR